MKHVVVVTLALSLAFSTLAAASGSSGLPSPAVPSNNDPLVVTETLKCEIVAIREDGTILVRDGKDQPVHPLPYGESTRVVAQSKKEFDGRKKLEREDLRVGHQLRVTYLPGTGEVVRIKVLKSS